MPVVATVPDESLPTPAHQRGVLGAFVIGDTSSGQSLGGM
jgi:hypothetical protein